MKRIDFYSLLIQNNYHLPKNWFQKGHKKIRGEMYQILKQYKSPEIKEKMALYTDEQWNKLILRLSHNNRVKR